MAIACFIRYEIDPLKRAEFARYAAEWGRIIPKCGGQLIGYFLPLEGTNFEAWGLIACESLAAYEAYRARIRADPDGQKNFAFAVAEKCIVRETRTFVEVVPETFGRAAVGAGSDVSFDDDPETPAC